MKKRNTTLWALTLLGCLFGAQAYAQLIVNMPFNTGQQTFTIAPPGSFINFFDNGGSAANYSNTSNPATSVVTFAPSFSPANKIRATFNSFATENSFDALYVRDGSTTASTLFNSGAPIGFTSLAGGWQGQPGIGFPIAVGQQFQASPANAAGTLTFQFESDFSVTLAGWNATITEVFVQPCTLIAPANLTISTTATTCDGTATVAFPNSTPTGCATAVGSFVRYRINNGAFINVLQPYPASITITGLPRGINIITYQLIDAGGTILSVVTQIITVLDLTPPFIICPANVTFNLDPGLCNTIFSYSVTFGDNCPASLVGYYAIPDTNIAVSGLSLSCAPTNHYFQVIPPAGGPNQFSSNVNTQFVRVGINAAWGGFGVLTARIYRLVNTALPYNVTSANRVLLGASAPFTVPPGSAGQKRNIPLAVTIPANSFVLLEVESNAAFTVATPPGSGAFTWFASPGCVVAADPNNPQPFNNLGGGFSFLNDMYAIIYGSSPIVGGQIAGLPSGATYPIGVTTNVWKVTDASGNMATCSFTVTVNEFANPTTTLVCNDLVYVSLDETCTAVLGADQILEGGPYGCYDDYIVEVDRTPPYGNGPWSPGILGPGDVGKTYAVRVTDPETGNVCWGNLKVEDKLAPALDCPPAVVVCGQDLTPCAATIAGFVAAAPLQFPPSFAAHGGGTVFSWAGNTAPGGYYFNLTNNSTTNLSVSGFGLRFGNPAFGNVGAPQTVDVFTAPTFVGNEGNAAAWTNLGPGTVTPIAAYFATGTGPLSQLDLTANVTIPAGQTRGFHIFGQSACPIFNWNFGGAVPPVTNGAFTMTGGQIAQGLFSPAAGFGPCLGNIQVNYGTPGLLPCLPNGLTLGGDAFQTGPNTYVADAGAGTPTLENCSDVTLTYVDQSVDQDCATGLTQIVNRKWTATDASGNTSTCIQVISVQGAALGDVELPPSYDGVNNPAILCGGGYPTPEYLESIGLQGFPHVFGGTYGCSIGWTYTDVVIDICDGTYKIRRQWVIIDWCTGDDIEYNQIIKVMDNEGPSISCPANMTVSTDPFSCCAVVNLADVVITDNCSRINNISGMIVVRVPLDPVTFDTVGMFPIGGSLTTFPGNNQWEPDTLGAFGSTPCLPVGTHTVIYQAEDDCGNTSTCSYSLVVRDYVPPVAACDEFTVVGIGIDDPYDCYGPAGPQGVPPALGDCEGAGVTWVKASTFDDGSYDNCNNVRFTVQRMAPYSDCINGLNSTNGFLPCDDFFPDFPSEFERAISEQDSIKFYCCEVGTTQTVILRVYQVDAFGNLAIGPDGTPIQNSCMVQVEVQDKIKPVCVSPGNVTVSCEAFDPSLWAYGKPNVYDNCCLDTTKVYQGQCGLTHSVNFNLFDTVCNRGTITRTFRAFDCHGQSSQCTQRIIVTYEQDYYVRFPNDVIVTVCDGTGTYGEPVFFGDQDCELLGVSFEDQVFTVVPDACLKIERTWTVINWCTYNPDLPCVLVPNPNPNATVNHPTNLVGPIVSPITTPGDPWRATVVSITPGAPQTSYTVFYNPSANCYQYKQIIKIIDGQDPTVTNCPASPVTYCDLSPNDPDLWNQSYWWDEGTESHDLCEGDAPLTITATDACSGANINITYLLFLDLDGDGVMETVVNSNNPPAPGTVNYNNAFNPNYSGGQSRVFDGRPVTFNNIWRWANHQSVAGANRTASVQWKTAAQLPTPANQFGTPGVPPQLPYGTHKIKWTVTDGCGNETYCEYIFVVKDCKAPTVVCLNGLSVNIMPTDMITIWAVDFLQYAEDNCTPAGKLKFAIRKAGTGTGFPVDALGNPITSVTFTCLELGEQPVELWAMDLAGNASFCATFIDVQDPGGFCGTDKVTVAGALKTEADQGLEDANVNLQATPVTGAPTDLNVMTDDQGAYSFNDAVPTLSDYTVTPSKDDNPLNGVSTYDLVLISKHILGLEPLNSPYKMISADANKSNSITTFDIVEIRKLILGIYTEFPNNTSWRFADKGFAFPNPANPFQTQFPETKSVADVLGDQLAEDFVAMKTGDVNGTALPNSLLSADDRTAGTLLFDVDDRQVKAGEEFAVAFKAAEKAQGWQFTMNLSGLEVAGIEETDKVRASNFGVFNKEGALTASVDLREPEASEFVVKFRATKAGRLSEMLGVSSRITRAEAYSLSNNRMEVALRFNGQSGSVISGVGFELYQNQPNPFVNRTLIGFHLPEAAEATLSVFDETGRLLFTHKGQFAKGHNAVPVDRALLSANGLMWYKLETATDNATKKMIQTK